MTHWHRNTRSLIECNVSHDRYISCQAQRDAASVTLLHVANSFNHSDTVIFCSCYPFHELQSRWDYHDEVDIMHSEISRGEYCDPLIGCCGQFLSFTTKLLLVLNLKGLWDQSGHFQNEARMVYCCAVQNSSQTLHTDTELILCIKSQDW